MRVTNNIITRQFLTNNNRLLTQQIKSENRIATQRRFDRVSEDPINGSKAMTIRRQLRDLDIYNKTLSSTKALFAAAEINLNTIVDREYITVEERLTQAVNGTWSQDELNAIATELDEVADQMVKDLNGDFSERQIFGGASNGKVPFQTERVVIKDSNNNVVFPPDAAKYYDIDAATGAVTLKEDVKYDDIPRTVTYNGVPLDFDVTGDMILPDGTVIRPEIKDGDGAAYTVSVLNKKTGEFEKDTRPIAQENVNKAIKEGDNSLMYPGSKPIYVDIGLGVQYDENYEPDPQTVMDVSLNGAEITGNGIDIARTGVTGSAEAAAPTGITNGYPTGAGNFTMALTVNGKSYSLTFDLNAALPQKTDGTTYSDEQITEALNGALKDAYKAAAKKSLPGDISFSCKDGKISVSSSVSEIAVGSNNFGLPEGKVARSVPMDENGIPDVSERYSKNLIQLVMDAADALRRGDQSTVNAIIDRANEANNHIINELTTLGTKQNSIEFYQNKNEDYSFNLKERQNVVEGTDMENEIIYYEGVKAAYDATLKMGSQILPHSIFDFI